MNNVCASFKFDLKSTIFISLVAIFTIGLSISNGMNNANAVPRLAACTKGTGGTGIDGSDCDAELFCDSTGYCGGIRDMICVGGSGCMIGQRCVDESGDPVDSGKPGVCVINNTESGEDNALGDVMCNIFGLATGKAGRILIAIVLVGAGGTFLLGKMQLGSLLAIGAGAGFIFGAPAIVKILVGRGFDC